MRCQFIILVLFKLLSTSLQFEDDDVENIDYKIVCYYTNWSQYRPEPARYVPEKIDPNLCTHIIFAFAKIDDDSTLNSYESNDESTPDSIGMYQKVTNLKTINPNLKILLAVGGWNHGSKRFSDMARNDNLRKKFVESALNFILDHSFDGLDLDWEYPASRDTEDRPDDKKFFTLLCKDLKAAFKPYDLLLTAAVAAGEKQIKASYEISKIQNFLDFINLMAYDYHGSWENVTGHNAPLYRRELDKDKTLNIDWAVQYWISQGVPKEKLILGVAFYGRSFKLHTGFESCPITETPTLDGGKSGDYTREKGFLSYYEICEKLQVNNWGYVWNDEQEVPFAYSNEASSPDLMEWVGFDDVQSIEAKMKYLIAKGLGGAMIWSIDMDDFNGDFCHQNKYPLLKTINFFLNKKKNNIKLPDGSINWKTGFGNFSNSITETIHPMKKNEQDFIMSYNHDKLDEDSFFRTFNVFRLMKHDILHIYKFCQCKRGIQRVAPHDTNYDFYSLVVDCDKKILLSDNGMSTKKNRKTTKKAKTIDDYEYDSSLIIFSIKFNLFLCLIFILLHFIVLNLIIF